jgi:presenilin-like A22 family membrane protease
LIFVGSDIVFGSFFGEPIGLILAVGVVASRFLIRNVLTHNVGLTLAIAGIGAELGITLNLETIIILLVILSVYDVFAVFKSKHMIKMFKGLMEKGAAMAIIIPDNPRNFVKTFDHVKTEKLKEKSSKRKSFLMLGTGDIAFPVIFAVSALQISVISSISVVFGALAGVFLTHYLIMVRKIKALPALPPIALGCLIGFGLSLI